MHDDAEDENRQAHAYDSRVAKPTLHIVPLAPAPDTPAEQVRRRVRAMRPAHVISCHRCGGIEVIETKLGVQMQGGKTKGGTKQLVCACCWLKGERVVLA